MKKVYFNVKTILVGALFYGVANSGFAQNVGINATGANPDASAVLDVSSNDKGVLIPRVALTGTNDAATVTSPATSLLVYNTATISDVTPGFYYYDGTIWQRIVSGAVVGTDDQNISGSGLSGTTLTIGIEGGTSETVDLSSLQDGTGTDSQTLSLSGQTLSISGGNNVTLPSGADNMGNHTATQNVDLASSKLVGNGGSVGVLIQNDGHTRVENLPQYNQSTDTLLVIADNTGNLHNISLDSLASILIRDYGLSGGGSTSAPTYPAGTVHCTGTPTAIVDVLNPTTGKTWMDRNLGASQVATSSTDAAAYGDLYQWGRAADGHQCRTSSTTATNSTTDTPGHGDFITETSSPYDWRVPQNDNLWQGVNGVNNPCPSGYRLPTNTELDSERLSWGSNDAVGAFGSPLKLTLGGRRTDIAGGMSVVGLRGYYWSGNIGNITEAKNLNILAANATVGNLTRASGFSIRCIKD